MSIEIRESRVEDSPLIAKTHIESWQSAYRGIISQSYLDALDLAVRTEKWEENLSMERTGPYRHFVALEGGRVVGLESRDADMGGAAFPGGEKIIQIDGISLVEMKYHWTDLS